MRLVYSAIILAGMVAGPVLGQSVDNGEKTFKRCASCHKVGPDAKNGVGPVLTGVVDRAAGSFEGYRYSKSMRAAGAAGLVWSQENIVEYIANPTAFLRVFLDDKKAKAKMTFKLKAEDDRRDVVAYLATFSAASVAVPDTGFCVVNASQTSRFFATETREGVRESANLEPGAALCADTTDALDGVVTVYESEDGFEGCTRIIPVGSAEDMLKFAEADRCEWESHSS